MASITLKGNPVKTIGELPKIGTKAPGFTLVKSDLSTVSLSDFAGHPIVLNIFPSLDTGTCAASVRRFNKEATQLNNTKVLCISKDLPFAHARFCGAEGIEHVINLSDFRTGTFSKDYGLEIIDSPLAGLCSRAVIILDSKHQIIYTEQVSETVNEPDYEKALRALTNT